MARAERMPIAGVALPVARTADLLLLKLAAGGYMDRHDAAVLLTLGDRGMLVAEVEAHLADVRPNIRRHWQELLTAVPDR